MASSLKTTIVQVKGPHLIVESLRDETVVFDRRTNKAHMLDARATAIWNAAENGCSLEDVLSLVDGSTAAQKEAAAQLGISDLERAGLLVTDMPALHRRGLLKTLGAAAMIPMVISILAPTPAAAASLIAAGSACTFGVSTCVASATCVNGTATGAPTTRCCYATNASIVGSCFGNGTNNAPTLTCCSGSCGAGSNKTKCS